MIFRSIFISIVMFSLVGCLGIEHKDHSKKAAKKPTPDMPDQSQDTSFQGFLGRLRTAAKTRDLATLASMMTSNFGYAINPDREGDGVFQYWDEKDLWREIELVLSEKFVPHENYMVAPAQFAADPEHFSGYRAGIRMVNGSWKFAYCVGGSDAKP